MRRQAAGRRRPRPLAGRLASLAVVLPPALSRCRPAHAAAALLACMLTLLVASAPAEAPPTPESLVNPFIGTQDYGNTFPGASLPFGMVQLSPDNGGQAGYDHDNTRIDGFSHTHLSGVGCGALGEVRVMPTTGAVTSDRARRASARTTAHDTEAARPGYYAVDLTKYGIRAELTRHHAHGLAPLHVPAGRPANVLFDVGRANMPVRASSIHVMDDHTLEGSVADRRLLRRADRHRVFFTARFDRPFAATGTWRGGHLHPGRPPVRGGRRVRRRLGARSARRRTASVGLQVGISYASLGGARRNLAAEADGAELRRASPAAALAALGLDARPRAGRRRLGRRQRRLRDRALPRLPAPERDRRRRRRLPRRRTAGCTSRTDHTPMGNLSLWDTFRTQNQLLELLAPDVARDVALSILADGRRTAAGCRAGRSPGRRRNVMTGRSRHALPGRELVRRAARRPRAEAYRAPARERVAAGRRRRSPATAAPATRYYAPARVHPAGGPDCLAHATDSDCRRPASATLEYAAADGALALMARALGHRARRAAVRSPRPQLPQPVEPARRARSGRTAPTGAGLALRAPVSGQFHEGSAYTVPLARPAGPRRAGLACSAVARRRPRGWIAFFDYPASCATRRRPHAQSLGRRTRTTTTAPRPTTRTTSPTCTRRSCTRGPGSRGRRHRRRAPPRRCSRNGPDGMTGNDDLGTMSAWYVLELARALPDHERRRLLRPQHAAVPARHRRSAGRLDQGGTLPIDAPGTSATRRYIATARL